MKTAYDEHKSAYDSPPEVEFVETPDVEPVVHAHWEWKAPYMVCSACNRHAINRYRSKYCQHCGAKMHNPRGAHMDERSDEK